MAIANIHGPYAVGVGSTVLGGIIRMTQPLGADVRGEPTDGNPYSRFVSLIGERIRPAFTTLEIPPTLNAIPLDGKNIADLVGGLAMYGYAHKDGATRQSGAAHRKYSYARGLLVPRTLACNHQDDAELNIEAFVTYDGINAPLILTENIAVPANISTPSRHTLGPMKVGDVTIRQVKGLSVDFGVNVLVEGSDSDIWESHASIGSIQPSVTIRGIDLKWFADANIPLLGKPATHLDTTIYLRSRLTQSTFHPDATPVHIKITAGGIATIESAMDANGNEASEATLTIRTQHDGVNTPLLINTASAIT